MKKKFTQTAPARAPVWRRVAPFAALWALILVAYSNSFSVPLVYDNAVIIAKDTRLKAATAENIGLIFSEEYWYLGNGNGLYRPLTTLSYLLNYSVLGDRANAAGYHWINYAIHAVNACLVFLLGLALFGGGARASNEQDRSPAALALAMAAIWAVHPALTESITNIVGRADELAAFGVLAALLCFTRAREARGSNRTAWLAGCAAATAIGVFSKESALVALGAIALFDWLYPKAQAWRERLMGYAAVALPCAFFLVARAAVLRNAPGMQIPYTDNPIVGAGFWQGRLTALVAMAREIMLAVFPLRLSADYSYNAIPLVKGFDVWLAVAIAMLAVLAALVAWAFRSDRALCFLILLGMGALLPTSNLLFPIGTIMADRFLYLPAVAVAGCAGALLYRLRGRAPLIACAAMVALFAARTFARNFDWRSDDELFRSAEAVVPDSFRPHSALAHGPIDTAVREADATMRILDPLPDRWNTVAPYIVAGQAYSDMADTLPPEQAGPWYEKAMAALQRGQRINRAVNEMFQQLALARGTKFQAADWSLLDENLGYVALRMHHFDESVAALERAMRVRLSREIFINLATAYAGRGDAADAEITLLEATIWRHQDNAIATQLVKTYGLMSADSCALTRTGDNVRLNFQCPLVEGQLCTASARLMGLLHDASEVARVSAGAEHAGCGGVGSSK